jgi:hypothetical protein
MDDNYLTTTDVAALLNTSPKQVAVYANNGRLTGAKKQGVKWAIPPDAILIPSDSKTINLLSYIDTLPEEERRELFEKLSKDYIGYLEYLLNKGYLTELERLKVNKAVLTGKKPEKKKTWVDVWTLIIESAKAIATIAVVVVNAAVKGGV